MKSKNPHLVVVEIIVLKVKIWLLEEYQMNLILVNENVRYYEI